MTPRYLFTALSVFLIVALQGAPSTAQKRTWTTSADFALGTLSSVQSTTVPDQLQLTGTGSQTQPYMYIANYRYSTISKVNTLTGKEEARYAACINNVGNTNACPDSNNSTKPYAYCDWASRGHCPSRTAVDLNGDVWVANRAFGQQATVTKIAGEIGHCIDRNGNGVIDTSSDLNANGRIDLSESENMPPGTEWKGQADECVLFTAKVGASNAWARGLTIDALNRVWVGGYNSKKLYLLNSSNGAQIAEYNLGWDIYGLATDALGNLYNAEIGPGRVSKVSVTTGAVLATIDTPYSHYGIAVDPTQQTAWCGLWEGGAVSGYRGGVLKVNFNNNTYTEYQNPSWWGNWGRTRGVAIDNQGRVWVANFDRHMVGAFNPTTNTWVANYTVGNWPIGVAIDNQNKIWTANNSGTATRIDPTNGARLDSPALGTEPYSYSDMTGYQLTQGVVQQGTWEVTYDGGTNGLEWGKLTWNESGGTCPAAGCVPPGTLIEVEARAWDGAAPSGTYVPVAHGVKFNGLFGRNLGIRAKLRITGGGNISPVLKDFTARARHLPEVFSAAPATVSVGFTGNIVLTGDNLYAGLTAGFGPHVTVNSIQVQSDTQATVNITVSPHHPGGAVSVTVNNGILSATWPAFAVTFSPPTILSATPALVEPGSTNSLQLQGQHLVPSATWSVSAGSVSSPSFVDLSTWTATYTAPNTPQYVNWQVTTPGGTDPAPAATAVYGIVSTNTPVVQRGQSATLSLAGVGFQGDEEISAGSLPLGVKSGAGDNLSVPILPPLSQPPGLYDATVSTPSGAVGHVAPGAVRVILPPVVGLTGEQRPGGWVYLAWSEPVGGGATAYRIYRKNSAFSSISQATLLTTVSGGVHLDTPPSQGIWHYGVVPVDATGFSGALSNTVAVASDPVPPTVAVTSNPPASKGPGVHVLRLTPSEPLVGVPTAVFSAPGGAGDLPLAPVWNTAGYFEAPLTVTAAMPSGQGEVKWSGIDLAGNTGTTVSAGRFITIDTTPPTGALAVSPTSPVKAGPLAITLTASEALQTAPAVVVAWPGGSTANVTMSGGPSVWTGTTTVPAGLNGAAALSFSGVDTVGNSGSAVTSGSGFTVDTQPPAAPALSGSKLSSGAFSLSWTAPPNEAGLTYRVYRSDVPMGGASSAAPVATTTQLTLLDSAPEQGDWYYLVRATDAAGNAGAWSNELQLLADPPPPEDVTGLVVTDATYVSITASFVGSANTSGLLQGYRCYLNGAFVTQLPATASSATFPNLQAGKTYALEITAFDSNNRESLGASLTGHTLVPHPLSVNAAPRDKGALLTWQPPTAPALSHFAIYVGAEAFTSIDGLTPTKTVPGSQSSATLQGLVNGEQVFVAVASVNLGGRSALAISSSPVTPADVEAPGAPSGLQVTASQATALSLQWLPSPNTAGDLAGYRIRRDGQEVSTVGPSTLSATVSGLAPASAYALSVTAYDGLGNESPAALVTGYTWLAHPTPVLLVPHDRSLGVSWPASSPSAHVQNYRIWVSPTPISNVSAVAPTLTVPGTSLSTTLTGLDNGATYHVAVAAVNKSLGMNPAVTSVSATPADDAPPANPGGLTVAGASDTTLQLTFTAPPNPTGDLAGYRLYVDNALSATLPAAGTSHTVSGLAPATAYGIKLTAFDAIGNESSGSVVTGYTWLANPAPVALEARHSKLLVSWPAALPQSAAQGYRVWIGTAPFSSTANLTPVKTLGAGTLSTSIEGLTNGVDYFVAVTAVNKSGASNPAVTPAVGQPVADTTGPTITDIRFGGAPLQGAVVAVDGAFSASAADPEGISHARFLVDGAVVGVDQSPANGLSAAWVLDTVADGPHMLTVEAFDSLGNASQQEVAFSVAVAAPSAPTISQPPQNFATNQQQVVVQGNGKSGTVVTVYVGANAHPTSTTVDGAGKWTLPVSLVPGNNSLTARLANAGGQSPPSPAVAVIYDNTVLAQPKGLSASAREGGEVKLEWFAVADTSLSGLEGYRIYRASAPFSDPSGATLITTGTLSKSVAAFDLPPGDGLWYYAVAARSKAGTLSALSPLASVTSDGTPPKATSIAFVPAGAADPGTGRVGVGPLSVVMHVSEPLLTPPFLSLTVPGGQPVPVGLALDSGSAGLIYTGTIQVTASTPSGLAQAVLSARDLAGNRGTTIEGPSTVLLDTDAPSVALLTLSPAAPLRNDQLSPLAVNVSVLLTEPLEPTEEPELRYTLASLSSAPELVWLGQIGPDLWQGSLVLPPQAGLVPDLLVFSYLGVDDLGNESTTILGKSSFEVYQGDLPALVAPLSLTATAMPGAVIALDWSNVGQAAEYQVYRKGPTDADFAPLVRVVESQHQDLTPADGLYAYRVTSIRHANGQEAESEPSPLAQATSDGTVPNPPGNLAATLASNGIQLTWGPPTPYTEPITYRIYRAAGLELVDITGMAPLVKELTQTLVVDPTPSLTDHAYVVAAEDNVGNVSAPSNSVYLNPGLLPVSSLTLVHDVGAGQKPRLTWTHPSASIASYDVWVESAEVASTTHPTSTWLHAAYASGAATYAVEAVDNGGQESLPRALRLVPITVAPAPGALIVRGHIAPVDFDVTCAEDVPSAVLRIKVAGREHVSAPFAATAGTPKRVSVVIGGYPELGASALAEITSRREPAAGERVDVVEKVPVGTRSDAYVAQVTDLDLERGAIGSARFAFSNPGPLPVEIVMAQASGNAASNQVRLALVDGDGNVLSTAAVQQSGAGTVALSNGTVVARVAPGATFVSDAMPLPVPGNAPDNIAVRLTIDEVHYDLGKPTAVKIPGLSVQAPGTLIEPPYAAVVSDAVPEYSFGDQPIEITGSAHYSGGGAPAPNVPVTLVIRLQGFERKIGLYTDAAGSFSHTFTPGPNEGGVYDVWAKYPELLTQPAQDHFSIQRVSFSPTQPKLTLAAGFESQLSIGVATTQGTGLTNLRLEVGTLPSGVTVTPASPQTWTTQTTGFVSATVVATAAAPAQSTFLLTLRSDERVWGTIPVQYTATTAKAQLVSAPTFVETGAVKGGLQMEEIVISNKGLAAAQNVTLELLNANKTAPAPGWASIASTKELPNIAAGATVPVLLAFAPAESTVLSAASPYGFWLRASSGGATVLEVPVYAWVSASGEGTALFKVIDMYTGSTVENTGVVGAKIKLDRLLGEPLSLTVTTGAGGEVLLEEVPAGNYRWRATATDHEAVEGNLAVKPGVTSIQTVFLPSPYITIEWDVTETTIEDSYEVVLSATFETDVPAPVVVVEPASISMPAMDPGEVFLGEFTIRNYGLIKAQSSTFKLPDGGADYKFELLASVPDELAAGQTLVVPYRVTKLDGNSSSGNSSGGGCCGANAYWGGFSYGWYCLAGEWVWGAFPIVYLRVDSSCCSTGKTGPITIPTPPYNPTSSSSSSGCSGPCGWKTPEWKSQSTKDKPCDPCEHPSLTPIEKECCHTGKGQPTNSEVDLVTGEYRDSVEDLPIQVLGWRVPFIRSYAKGKWNIELQNGDLQFNEVNGELASIQYDGVLFSKTGASNAVFEAGDGIALFASSAPAAAWELHGSSSSVFYFDAAGKLLRLENARGHQISLGRDANGRVSTMADTFGSVFATFAYNPDGTVASITAADGRSVQYAWANGNLSQVVDPAGGVTEYQYDAKGQITRKRKPNGAVDNLTYSTSGMVVSQLDDEGNGFYFDYGVNEATKQFYSAVTFTDGRLVERWFNEQGTLLVTLVDGAEQGELSDGAQVKVDPKGNITGTEAADGTLLDSTEYDSQGRVKRQTNSRGYVTEFVYDANGNTASETVRDGKSGPVVAQSLYSHDAHGRVVENIQVGLGGAPDAVTTYEYDNANNIVHETSSDGAEVFRTFDARGLQLSELDAQGNLVEWEYDALGRLVQRRLTNGSTGAMATEQWAFAPDVDETGKVIGERVVFTDADQRQTIERFDTRGRPVEIIDAWGRATRTTYDSQGDLVRLVTAEGDVTEFVRETLPSGLRRTTRKFNGEVASIEELDKFDRVVRRAVGSDEVTFIYDGSYPKPAEEVRPGVRLLYKYDYFGNRTEVITRFDDGEEVVETFAFDGMRQTSHTNALGQTFSEQFDDSDQLTQAMLPSGRTATTARDGLGRAVEHRSHSGDAALALAYDDGFQVSQRTLPNGTTLQYTYDAAGQITGLQTSFGLRIDLDVDRLGNPVEKRWFSSATDQTPDEVAQFEYDSVGQRTLSQNPTVSVETERDYFARTTTTTYDFGPFSKSFTVRHDSLGRTTALIMPDGDAYGFVYDGHGRLDGVHLPGSSSIDIAYPNSLTVERTYPNGVVFTDSRNPVLAPASVQAFDSQGTALMDWQYDMDAFRVAGITTEAGNYSFTYDADGQVLTATYPELSPDAFTYDADGNRLTAQATGSAAWSYSAADELLSIGALRSFTWNDAGDLASRADTGGTTTYEYDAAGRLHIVRAPSGAVVAEYRYDADGLRVVKKVGTTTTYAIYGEQGLLAEYDSTGAELRRYVWAPKAGAWQRELLVFEAAGERHFPLLDAGGEVQKLTNAAGAVSFDISLRVFGEGVVDAQSTVSFPLRPSGQYHDAETGLHYNLFRYYDPELGRYLSVDPLLEVGGNRNLYVFAFNNPVEYVDLMGLAAGYDGGDCMVNFKASLDFKDAACSVKFKINPLVSVKVKISVKPNRQDCCKNGVLIKQGKGCIEVKGSISGEVGVNPASYPGIDAIAKAAGIKLDIKAVTISASLGCNFCSKCGESGYGANFDKCCADLEVEGPSFSFSWKAFKISLKTGKVTIGKVCIGPYGWSLSGPSGEGPSGGGGGKW